MNSNRRIGPTAVAWVCAILIGCTETGNAPLEPGSRIWLSSLDLTTNEPTGATPISDQPWDSVGSGGWVHAAAGKSRIVVADSLPASPTHAIEFPFDSGEGGTNAGVDWYPLGGLKRVYARIWWRPSSPWQGASNSANQIALVHALNTDGQMYLTMHGAPGGPYELRMLMQFGGDGGWLVPNRNSDTVALGRWHKIEWMIDYQANASAGTVRWWLDGRLIGDYTDVPFPDQGLDAFGLAPYWGGPGETKTENDWFRFDHSYLSGPWTDATPAWPDEPPGLTTLTDYGFNDYIPAVHNVTPINPTGWYAQFNDSGGATHETTMSTAPVTPPDVAQFRYPIGFHDGSAPGTVFYSLDTTHTVTRKEVFAGFWWKPSSPWEGHWSNVNKIAFWFRPDNSEMFLAMYGPPGGPYRLRAIPQFPGLPSLWRLSNVDSTPVMLGVWHRIEWYVKFASVPQGNDGVVMWWLDGVLQGEHHDLQTPADGFDSMKISPTWGGGDTLHYPYKTEEDFFWYDQFHIAVRK